MSTASLRLIEFADDEQESLGFKELVTAGVIIRNVGERKYIVTLGQCNLLSSRGVKYGRLMDFIK